MRRFMVMPLVALLLVTYAGCSVEPRDVVGLNENPGPGPGPGPGPDPDPDPDPDPEPEPEPEPKPDCGWVDNDDFRLNRSDPVEHLFTWTFEQSVAGRMFVRLEVWRDEEDQELSNQSIRFYAVRDGDGSTVFVLRPGDSCGILPDTTGIAEPVTRWAGDILLPPGSWSFYAQHPTQAPCGNVDDRDAIEVIETRFEWCVP